MLHPGIHCVNMQFVVLSAIHSLSHPHRKLVFVFMIKSIKNRTDLLFPLFCHVFHFIRLADKSGNFGLIRESR